MSSKLSDVEKDLYTRDYFLKGHKTAIITGVYSNMSSKLSDVDKDLNTGDYFLKGQKRYESCNFQ